MKCDNCVSQTNVNFGTKGEILCGDCVSSETPIKKGPSTFKILSVLSVVIYGGLYCAYGAQVKDFGEDMIRENGLPNAEVVGANYSFTAPISGRSTVDLIVENNGKTSSVQFEISGRPLFGSAYGSISQFELFRLM